MPTAAIQTNDQKARGRCWLHVTRVVAEEERNVTYDGNKKGVSEEGWAIYELIEIRIAWRLNQYPSIAQTSGRPGVISVVD